MTEGLKGVSSFKPALFQTSDFGVKKSGAPSLVFKSDHSIFKVGSFFRRGFEA